MATQAFSGVGTSFQRETSTPGLYAAISEVNQITGPGLTRERYDATSLDSTGGYREYIPGFRDGGDVVLNMNFSANNYFKFKDDFDSDVVQSYKMILSDPAATTIVFDGYVVDMPMTVVPDDKVTLDVTIKVTGAVTATS